MKKMLSLVMIIGSLLMAGCSSDWVRYPHVYEGTIEIEQKVSGYSPSRHYYSGKVKTRYLVDCTPEDNKTECG